MAKAVILYGGNTRNSRLKGILDKAVQVFERENVETETLFIHELPAEDLIRADFESEAIRHANRKVETADIIVVLTPVYKAAYTGILKTYLDLLPQKGLEGKIVVPLVLGGSFGHLLTIDYALKPVLSALGATTILNGVYVVDQYVEKQSDGLYVLEKGIDQRIDEIVTQSVHLTHQVLSF